MVVLGNPPYSGHSSNKGSWIEKLLADYKQEPGGGRLQEKNPKWLNDDYVKFIRYGQHYIEKNGSGILAFINNHSFLDNPTFRGMRWHLLTTFDKIYIIDLHGNTKKKEKCPDGSPDKNVFDIQQGVSINIFIKTGEKAKKELGQVFHHDLFGSRESKYSFATSTCIPDIPFIPLGLLNPQFLFCKSDDSLRKQYEISFSLAELFPINSVGIVTARDSFTIHESKEKVKKTIEEFLSLEAEQARSRFQLGKDARDWKVDFAQSDLQQSGPDFQRIVEISYRPFDKRFTYYTGKSRGFHCMPRGEVMQHFLKGENVGLSWIRPMSSQYDFSIFITDKIIDQCYSGNKSAGAGITYTAPLYLYPNSLNNNTELLFENNSINLNSNIVRDIANSLALSVCNEKEPFENTFAPIDLLDYIYAVLHSPAYREKYKEFLKIDFPRVPYPTDKDVFWKLVALGGELRQLHLLESAKVDQYITSYPVAGDNEVVKISFEGEDTGKVWINADQYFENVPLITWEFYIGGYQPAQKWLKDRKGRKLSFEDIMHYQRVIVALTETHRLMQKIETVVSF